MCIEPVGEGAIRVTTEVAASVSEAGIAVPADGRGRPRRGVRGLITRGRRLPSLAQIAAGLGREVAGQADRALLWTPVAFGIGSASYLALKSEPPLWMVTLAAAICCPVALAARGLSRRRGVIVLAGLAAVASLGLFTAKLHSDQIAAPIAPANLGAPAVEGWVVDIETPSERGERLLIAPTWVSGLRLESTPRRIRIVVAAPGGPDGVAAPGSSRV